jgi:hypothetical protein
MPKPDGGCHRVVVAILVAFVFEPDLEAKSATVAGVIFTRDSGQVQTVWPNVRVKSLHTNNEVARISDDLGTYAFTGVCMATMKSLSRWLDLSQSPSACR